MAGKSKEKSEMALPSLDVGMAAFELRGESPLLMNCFHQKSFEQMLAKMTGYDMPRQNKDLSKEYENAFIRNINGTECIPSRWVRSAIESATPRSKKMISATSVRCACFVMGHSLPIRDVDGKILARPKSERKAAVINKDLGTELEPMLSVAAQQQIDIVRVGSWGNKQPDVRVRPVYEEWSIQLVVRFFPDQLNLRQIAWGLDAAGKFVGLCEWRPEKSGTYGTFRVDMLSEKEIPRIIEESKTHMPRLQVPPWLMHAAETAGMSPAQAIDQVQNAHARAIGSKKNGKAETRV